jgi:hypothetical protein
MTEVSSIGTRQIIELTIAPPSSTGGPEKRFTFGKP